MKFARQLVLMMLLCCASLGFGAPGSAGTAKEVKKGVKNVWSDVKEAAKGTGKAVKDGAVKVGKSAKEGYQQTKEAIKKKVKDESEKKEEN